jgi:hypothetical protein
VNYNAVTYLCRKFFFFFKFLSVLWKFTCTIEPIIISHGNISIEWLLSLTFFPPTLWSTGVLCLWLHATGFSDSHRCYCMCDNCGDILFVKCWELQLAMDIFSFSSLNRCLCISVLNILLLCEDKDVRLLPNQLLFWIHYDVLSWTRNSLW